MEPPVDKKRKVDSSWEFNTEKFNGWQLRDEDGNAFAFVKYSQLAASCLSAGQGVVRVIAEPVRLPE